MSYLDKQVFLQQYILSRTSHKRTAKELLEEGSKVWEAIDTETYVSLPS